MSCRIVDMPKSKFIHTLCQMPLACMTWLWVSECSILLDSDYNQNCTFEHAIISQLLDDCPLCMNRIVRKSTSPTTRPHCITCNSHHPTPPMNYSNVRVRMMLWSWCWLSRINCRQNSLWQHSLNTTVRRRRRHGLSTINKAFKYLTQSYMMRAVQFFGI